MASSGEAPQAQTNLEIKARCADLPAARAVAERLATRHLGIDEQTDTYFVTRKGRLKLRESSLSGGQLIPYLRLHGFDTTMRGRMVIVPPPPDRPELNCPLATELLSRTLFLPCYPEMPDDAIDRLCELILGFTARASRPIERGQWPPADCPPVSATHRRT